MSEADSPLDEQKHRKPRPRSPRLAGTPYVDVRAVLEAVEATAEQDEQKIGVRN